MKRWILLATLLSATAVWSGTVYEWRDPATGQLRLGENPPPGAAFWKPGNESLGESTKRSLEEVAKQAEQSKAAQARTDPSLHTCTLPNGQTVQQVAPCSLSNPTKTSSSSSDSSSILSVLGFMAALIFLGSLFVSRKCTVCGTRIKKKYFTWKINGEKEVMCPKCNSRMENRMSRQAFSRKFR
jgi:DNA-directed RNA polymerase subunit RPC12/RpoP